MSKYVLATWEPEVAGFGWQTLPKVYAVAMLVTAILFWVFSYTDKSHQMPAGVSFAEQMKVLKDPRVWRYCQ